MDTAFHLFDAFAFFRGNGWLSAHIACGCPIMEIMATRASVLYDGACAFCCKSIELLKKLDWLGKLEYVDVRDQATPILKTRMVVDAPLLEQMHVLTRDGQHLLGGYRAIRWLAWRLPALWLIAPLLYLPGMTYLGQRFYLWIARNRFKIVPCAHGVCEIPHDSNRTPG